jgi:hypothetical protein
LQHNACKNGLLPQVAFPFRSDKLQGDVRLCSHFLVISQSYFSATLP